MSKSLLITISLILAICFTNSIVASANEPNTPVPATSLKPKTGVMVYRQSPRRTLTIYYPEDWSPGDKRSALVIFRCNIPFQREHFRGLGMVIIKPQTAPVNSGLLPKLSLEEIAKLPKPRHQVEDTRSAMRFIRQNAEKLGIDDTKIVATGTSGGGDLALQSTINREFDHPQDNLLVSPKANALVLYCPAFDGIDIWFVKSKDFLTRVKTGAPAFLPLLDKFVKNTTDTYAVPADHRATLISQAKTVGQANGISDVEIRNFQEALMLFNKRDWQLLHPAKDALKMSASRILTRKPLPPTLIMFGNRDHLYEHQIAFVEKATSLGHKFDLKIYKGGGHSFMMQPAFQASSTRGVEKFLRKHEFLP